MKKVLIALLVVVVLVVGAVAALPFLVPTETYKAEIARRVEAATGRELVIGGDLNFSVLPELALTAEDVRFANVAGAADTDMARLKALQVELKPWPLLRGSVEVDRFVLVEPEVHLAVDAEGRPNWRFGAGDEGAVPAAEPTPAGEPGAGDADGGGGEDGGTGVPVPVTGLRLGDIRIEDGVFTFSDARTGTTERIEDVDLGVELPSIEGPLAADGSLRYEGREVRLDLRVASPLALLQGGTSEVTFGAAAEPAKVSFDGAVTNAVRPEVAGAVDLDVVSIRDLAAWLADEPPAFEGEGLRRLAVSGRLVAAGDDYAFEDAAIQLDDIQATGEVAVDLAGARPRVTGRLDVGALDLNPYLVAPAEDGEAEEAPRAGDDGGGTPAADDGWSDEPIALPPVLGVADVDLDLTADSLRVGEIEAGPAALSVTTADRTLTAELKELGLYGGRGRGTVEVEAPAEGGAPVFRTRLTLEDVEALPLLRAAAEFERLEGAASADLDLTTRGLTERELVSNLNGQGRVTFRDGAIVGVNLAAMVRNIGSAFLDPAAGETRKTDFAELGGGFTARDGVIANDDLTLQAPVIRLAGAGTVDLPERRIDYRIEPKAVATLEGQGGRADAAGLLVPVIIEGPLMDPEIRPDLSEVLNQAARSPEELKRQVEQLGDAAKDLKEGLKDLTEGDGVSRLIQGLSGNRDAGEEAPSPDSPLPQLLDRLFQR